MQKRVSNGRREPIGQPVPTRSNCSDSLRAAGGVPETSADNLGRCHRALDEVIAKINDLFSGNHPDSSVRSVVTHVRDRLEESETLHQQAQHNSLAQFSASPDLKNEFVAAVIGTMNSSSDLSAQFSTTTTCRRNCSPS
jgi:hypothetical protein